MCIYQSGKRREDIVWSSVELDKALLFLHQVYLLLVDHIWHQTHCLFIQLSSFVVFKTTFYNDPAL